MSFREGARSQALMAYALGHRIIRRSGSARRSQVVTAGVSRSNITEWNEVLASRHALFREAVEPVNEPVSVICVTSRPNCIDRLLDDVASQLHPVDELVLVTNSERFDEVDVEGLVSARSDVLPAATVLRHPPDVTLGACLNAAMEVCGGRFVAKFDDDDLYGPHHLADSMRSHSFAGAGIVGKHTYYGHLVHRDETVLRFPGHEFTYSSTLSGGTLVIDRGRTRSLAFPEVNIGEDRAFIQACLRRGLSTFSADRFSFVQTRSNDNTWQLSVGDYAARSLTVGPGLALDVAGL